MSFWGNKFTFDGVPSDIYDLRCGQLNASGEDSSSSGAQVDIIEDYIPRRSKPYFYGTQFNDKLEFELSFFSENAIDRYLVQAIEQWLFGHKVYKKLQILQCDMYDMYFNCILNKGEVITVGNEVMGFKCTVICDSPWGWGKQSAKTISSISDLDETIEIVNSSDDINYLYPILTFYSPVTQENVRIINTTDNNREMNFSSLISGETISIDNDIKLVESNQSGIYERFNGVYFRLLRGRNLVRFVGDLNNIIITYVPARKVGS